MNNELVAFRTANANCNGRLINMKKVLNKMYFTFKDNYHSDVIKLHYFTYDLLYDKFHKDTHVVKRRNLQLN